MSLFEITFIAAVALVAAIAVFLLLWGIMDAADRLRAWLHDRRADRIGSRGGAES